MIHTFFINATSGKLDYYQDLLTMEIEKRNLLMLEYFDDKYASEHNSAKSDFIKDKRSYFIQKWNDIPLRKENAAVQYADQTDDRKKPNFYHCAKKIAEIIDSDKEVGSDYNLIVYINLMDFDDYRNAVSEAEDAETEEAGIELYRCREAFRRLLRAFVHETLIKTLEKDFSYAPIETLLILDTGVEPIDSGSDGTTYEWQHKLLGLDSAFFEKDFSKKDFENNFLKEKSSTHSFWKKIREIYMDSLKKQLAGTKTKESRETVVNTLLGQIERDCKKKVKTVLFERSRLVAKVNNREAAEARLARCFYLLQCVNRGTVLNFENSANNRNKSNLKVFTNKNNDKNDQNRIHNTAGDDCVVQFESFDLNWTEITGVLKQKYEQYVEELQKFPLEDDVCLEAKKKFKEKTPYISCERYGLTESGTEKPKTLPRKNGVPKDENQEQNKEQKSIIDLNLSKEMDSYMALEKETIVNMLFSENSKEKNAKAKSNYKNPKFKNKEELVMKAKEIKQTNDEFPEKLQRNVKAMLSNYAHASEKDTVKLPKRSQKNSKRYLFGKASEQPKVPIDVKDLANAAYQTAKEGYLRESKVYTVSASNIDEPFEVLENKAKEIDARIQNLNKSAMTVSGILFFVYLLPFFLIQWRLIAENLFGVGLAGALISSAIPFVILFFVFGYLVRKEKEGYTIAYKEYLEAVKEAVAQNQESWENYINVFSNRIPALRYLYEYKTDIDCAYRDYEIDKGKCKHHREHLERCKTATKNILSDLGGNPKFFPQTENTDLKVDYEKPFSCGDNEAFYTILTQGEIETILKKN